MSRLTIFYARIWQEPRTLLSEYPIRAAIESADSVERYSHEWVVGNLDVDEERRLLTGKFGYPETGQRVQEDYDPLVQEFLEQTVEVPDAASAAFALDYDIGLLAFEETERIGPTGFVNHLAALLNTVEHGFKGELIRIARDYKVFLNSVDKVTRVSFDVVPTNPRDRPIFRPLDKGMRSANADRQRVVLENDQGLSVPPPASREETTDNPAVMGIEMVEEGYGQGYRIDATKDGKQYRYDSGEGGLLRDVIDEASEEVGSRTKTLVNGLESKDFGEERDQATTAFDEQEAGEEGEEMTEGAGESS